MSNKRPNSIDDLMRAGIGEGDAIQLRRISMQLHRWHELECGDSNEHASWTVTRGRKENGEFVYDDNGMTFMERHFHRGSSPPQYSRIPDRETSAKKRLARVMAKYPGFLAFIQTDPRGCALYILRPGDVPADADVSSCYNRGLAVYR